jgi:hypothetical protein
MKEFRFILAGILLLLSGIVLAVETPQVYMVAKNKITGTTFTQAVFFQSDEIITLAECETELEYGLTSGWRIYTHLLRKVQGFDYSTQYSCAESDQLFSIWIGQRSARRVIYLVSNKNGRLTVKPQESYATCMKYVRTEQVDETHELFCGRSLQKIIE